MFLEFIQSFDWESFLIFYRISIRSKNDTYSRIVFKLKIYLIQCSVNTSLNYFDNIILHSGKNHLCFRITKTCIIL